MSATGATTPTASKAIFERAIKQLDERDDSFSEPRHRPIVSGRIASAKSQEQVLQDAANALAALWRNRKH